MTRFPLLALVARMSIAPAAVSAVFALGPEARAQILETQPYYAVVTTADTLLRCGDWDKLYAIARLKAGQVVRVDGESAEWCRVAYPAGVGAFVDGEFASVSSDGTTVRLTGATKLKAANVNTGIRGSWKPVLDQPLAVGTELKVLERVSTGEAGREAFRVIPPASARAFIARDALRRATEAEAAAHRAATGEREPAPKAPEPKPQPVTPEGGGALLDPIVRPTPGETRPAEPVAPSPAIVEQTRPVEVKEPEPGSLEALDLAFESVRREPIMEAEIDELLAAFEEKLGTINASDDTGYLRRQVEQRIEILKIRRDLQAQIRALAEARKSIDQETTDLDRKVAEVMRTQQYTLVGRLTTSSVYDGVRLPRMYRIQSIGGAYARTLGYVKPDANLQIEPKVGLVVGVVGEATLDQSLQLNIITPKRVDILTPEGR